MDKEIVQIIGVDVGINGGWLIIKEKEGFTRVPFAISPAPFDIEATKVLIGEGLSRLRIARQLTDNLAEWFGKDLEVEVP